MLPQLPDRFRIDTFKRVGAGESNEVYYCRGDFDGHKAMYVKASRQSHHSLANERAVLEALEASTIPTPTVLWYELSDDCDVVVLGEIPGEMIWDFIDPRRSRYDESVALRYLRSYGECLAEIHSLDLDWPPQSRGNLYHLIGEQSLSDDRFTSLVGWIRDHEVSRTDEVFVHGDFNTASVLFENDVVSGVLDWEFAGQGWCEYDLAWALRSRMDFLNTEVERMALLDGYTSMSGHDEKDLLWCEVLNYLHFAFWTRDDGTGYCAFALRQAEKLIERT